MTKKYLTIYTEDGVTLSGPLIEAENQHEANLKLKSMQDANLLPQNLKIVGELISNKSKNQKDESEG